MKKVILLIFLFGIFSLYSQSQTPIQAKFYGNQNSENVTSSSMRLIVEKLDTSSLRIPINIAIKNGEIDFKNLKIQIKFNETLSNLTPEELNKIEIIQNPHFHDRKDGYYNTFYLNFPKELNFKDKDTVIIEGALEYNSNEIPFKNNLLIKLRKTKNLTYTLFEYLSNKDLNLDEIIQVEQKNNLITLKGFLHPNTHQISERNIILHRNQNYLLTKKNFSIYKPAVSLTTVPIQVRPEIGSFKTTATSGLSNLGLNMDFFGWKRESYRYNGKKIETRIGLGVLAAPSVHELDSRYTNNYLTEKSKQLFFSAGLTLMYSRNSVNFIIVPRGWDFATSTIGKNWVYNEEGWWGFGIGTDLKLLSNIF